MPSTAANVAMAGAGVVAVTSGVAFVAPGSQVQRPAPKTNLRASGYGASSQSSMGAMAGLGAVAGLAAAGVAGKRASNRTSMQAVGVGINGFGRIGRQVARIAMKDPETDLKLINASYDADYLAYMMKYDSGLAFGKLCFLVQLHKLRTKVMFGGTYKRRYIINWLYRRTYIKEYPGSLVQGSFYACISGLHKHI